MEWNEFLEEYIKLHYLKKKKRPKKKKPEYLSVNSSLESVLKQIIKNELKKREK
jgi:hypothetical protein